MEKGQINTNHIINILGEYISILCIIRHKVIPYTGIIINKL